jgi:hypothetical protein
MIDPQTTRDPLWSDEDYLKRMEVETASDIVMKIVNYIKNDEEDDYYAVKYGRRMIEAFVEVECKKRGAIY